MADVTSAGRRLEVRHAFKHSPEKVFDAWTDAAGMRRWMKPGPTTDVRAELDVRVGGKYTIEMVFAEGSIKHWGEYTVVDRPNKLEFSWNADHFEEPTAVTVLIAPSNGGCDLVLVHDGLPDETSVQNHTDGWGTILKLLSEALD